MDAKRLQSPCIYEFTEKGSRFLGYSFPTETLPEFEEQLEMLSNKFRDASHIAYAYKITDAQGVHVRFFDAGEPSGTAGRPILNHIEGRSLEQVSVFVIRYFGGTKLGAGGLVRAYGHAAKGALPDTELIDYVAREQLTCTMDYPQKQHFEYQLKQYDAEILQVDYAEQVNYQIRIAKRDKAALLEIIEQLSHHA